jgi:hypothetical protein
MGYAAHSPDRLADATERVAAVVRSYGWPGRVDTHGHSQTTEW